MLNPASGRRVCKAFFSHLRDSYAPGFDRLCRADANARRKGPDALPLGFPVPHRSDLRQSMAARIRSCCSLPVLLFFASLAVLFSHIGCENVGLRPAHPGNSAKRKHVFCSPKKDATGDFPSFRPALAGFRGRYPVRLAPWRVPADVL